MDKFISMKKLLLLCLTLTCSLLVFSQHVKPAEWSFAVGEDKVETAGEIELVFTTDIVEGGQIYSSDFGDCPPIKAKIEFAESEKWVAVDELKPIGAHKYTNDIFEYEVSAFKEKAELRQTIKVLEPSLTIEGKLTYQICTKEGYCVLFNFPFKAQFKEGVKIETELSN